MVTDELIEAEKDYMATRGLQRLLKSKNRYNLPPSCLPAGTEVYYYFNTSKCNVPIEWLLCKVITINPYFVTKLTDKNRKTGIAYKDIRLRPKTKLSQELCDVLMEDFISESQTHIENDATKYPEHANDADKPTFYSSTTLLGEASRQKYTKAENSDLILKDIWYIADSMDGMKEL